MINSMHKLNNLTTNHQDNNNQPEIDTVDINSIGLSLIRNIKLLVSFSIAGFILAGIKTITSKPVWQGEIQVVLESDKNKFSGLNEIDSPLLAALPSAGFGGEKKLKTEVKILQSPSILMPVYKYVKNEKEKLGINVSRWSYKSWVKNHLSINLEKGTSVLDLKYKDDLKLIIVPVLNKISNAYQEYSGRDRAKGLNQGIDYLENQKIVLQSKSIKSMSELQKYAIKHGLGNEDGMPIPQNKKPKIDLSSLNNSNLSSNSSNNQALTNAISGDIITPNDSQYSSNRYQYHFKKLQGLEAQLIEKSAYIKPSSEYIKALKQRISSLRDSVSRPTEILVNYRDLKRKALRDEAVTEKIESQLVSLKLEKARQTNPWELITTPTLIEKPISPNKKFDLALGLLIGTLLGIFASLYKDERKGIVYEFNLLKDLIPFNLLKTLPIKSKDNWQDIIYLISTKINSTNSLGIINLGENYIEEINFISENLKKFLPNTNIIVSNNYKEINDCDVKIIVGYTNYIKKRDLYSFKEDFNIIDKSTILGWLYIE